MFLATKTLEAIERTMQEDRGSSYRVWLGKVIPAMDDAYRADNFPFRTHMGASGIGGSCPRKVWYGFHWTKEEQIPAQLMRLFNRGHLEEARFIALLLSIGMDVYNQTEDGKQFKISDAGGHYGGSGDGVGINCPDLPPGVPCVLEFKTSADSPFKKLIKEGVRTAKWEHYVQMNQYMGKMQISYALYMCVNKNNDALHAEIVPFDPECYEEYLERGRKLVWMDRPPKRLNDNPSFFECKWCNYHKICHRGEQPRVGCRTCKYAQPYEDGTWKCSVEYPMLKVLDKNEQLNGCDRWSNNWSD